MISSEVQRTLVKSPPELWAELSDPAALARHLGELGEIRITHIEPERAVEWEAQDISGTVLLKASGWGTKVTLSVVKEIPQATQETTEPESSAVEEQPIGPAPAPAPALEAERRTEIETEPQATLEAEPSPGADHEPPAEIDTKTAPEAEHAVEAGSEPVPDAEHGPEAQTIGPQPEPEARRGFFSRLFRRSPGNTPAELHPIAPLSSTAELANPETTAEAHLPEPVWAVTVPVPNPPLEPVARSESLSEPAAPREITTEPEALEELLDLPGDAGAIETGGPRFHRPGTDAEPPDIAAELRAAEEVAAEQVTAVLTGMLDRLGAAHHRPFSRS
jgi:hypothetical protein